MREAELDTKDSPYYIYIHSEQCLFEPKCLRLSIYLSVFKRVFCASSIQSGMDTATSPCLPSTQSLLKRDALSADHGGQRRTWLRCNTLDRAADIATGRKARGRNNGGLWSAWRPFRSLGAPRGIGSTRSSGWSSGGWRSRCLRVGWCCGALRLRKRLHHRHHHHQQQQQNRGHHL